MPAMRLSTAIAFTSASCSDGLERSRAAWMLAGCERLSWREATTGGLQFHWLDYDAPYILGTPFRARAQLIYERNSGA